jgi:hypothetical protein
VLTRLERLVAARSTLVVTILAILGLGAYTRASGFSTGEPWFDDAWVVLPAREPLSRAIHMVDTTPLFTLGMRSWIRLEPHNLPWAQAPIFVLGLASIVAVYLVMRYFGFHKVLCLLGALVIAVSPVAVQYSTRIKQYNLDIIFACAILWLLERWRRSPSGRGAVALATVGALALLTSASTLVVIAPACVVVAHGALVEARRRRGAALVVGVIGGVFVLEYAIWLRHLSHGLHVGWTNRGYLLTFKTFHKFVFSLENMGSEFFHWMVGVPTGHPPDPSKQITPWGVIVSLLVATALIAAIAPLLWRAVKDRRRVADALVAPAGVIALAILLALVGVSPFGGGRTDEVIYPAILIIFAHVVSVLLRRPWSWLPRVAVAGAIAATGACALVASRNTAVYPTTRIAPVFAEVEAVRTSHQFLVVDPWLTFTWADGGFTKTSVSFRHTFFDWSQGFHVVSDRADVVISRQYFFPDWNWRFIHQYTHQLWYFAMTSGPSWPAPGPNDPITTTRNYHTLRLDGWVPSNTYFRSSHVEAVLMNYVAADDTLLHPPPTK